MNSSKDTVREMWRRQRISLADVDYDRWERRRTLLGGMSATSRSCIFTVDVYRGVYDYASGNFADMFGVAPRLLKDIRRQGDLIEDLIHPEDRDQIATLQLGHGNFIYGLAPEERNDFRTAYQWRMRSTCGRYINVTSHQQVIETDRNGKAWIIMGMIDVSPDQAPSEGVKFSTFNLKTGSLVSHPPVAGGGLLTPREIEVLSLIRRGLLSKEIASRIGTSVHTVNNHRKNILAKLQVDNSIEAINIAVGRGLI